MFKGSPKHTCLGDSAIFPGQYVFRWLRKDRFDYKSEKESKSMLCRYGGRGMK